MTLVVDDTCLGTPAAAWRSSPRVAGAAPLELGSPRKVVVVAPHPDDEVFGAGGLIQRLRAQGRELHIVAVTDGEASHPRSALAPRLDLRALRSSESEEALRRLGCAAPRVTRLRIPDGGVAPRVGSLRSALGEILDVGDLCLAPWVRDGHPDHDACGEIAAAVGGHVGARVLGYLVWAWHWARPEGADIPWSSCGRLDLSSREAARKRWATGAFRSQTRPLGPAPEDGAVLPAPVLRRFWQDFEVYVDSGAGPS